MVKGFRSEHKAYFKPSLGGFRLDPNLSLQDYEAMSAYNSVKNAVCKIPMTGSGGGLSIGKHDLPLAALDKSIETYVTEMGRRNFIGPHLDVYMPEITTEEREMDMIKKHYS